MSNTTTRLPCKRALVLAEEARERAAIRARQERETRCWACERWHERGTPGALFCPICAARLNAITWQVMALFGERRHERAA